MKTISKNGARKISLAIIGGFVIFAAGCGIGSAGKAEVAPPAEITKPVTPPSCLRAIELDEEAFGYFSESMNALSEFDIPTSEYWLDKAKAIVTETHVNRIECRAH